MKTLVSALNRTWSCRELLGTTLAASMAIAVSWAATASGRPDGQPTRRNQFQF